MLSINDIDIQQYDRFQEYGKRHHLREHERKHTGDMRFACDVCGKKFYMQVIPEAGF
jgi:hypothetical protein